MIKCEENWYTVTVESDYGAADEQALMADIKYLLNCPHKGSLEKYIKYLQSEEERLEEELEAQYTSYSTIEDLNEKFMRRLEQLEEK